MFQSQIAIPISVVLIGDLGDETYTLWKAPFAGEVVNLWAVPGATITAGSGTGLSLVLQNGGTTGTATTAIGTVGSGTADTGWVVDTGIAGSIGVATFVAGDYLCVKYDETGTVNTAWLNIGMNVRYGTS
jgi:hypothetical protein